MTRTLNSYLRIRVQINGVELKTHSLFVVSFISEETEAVKEKNPA